MMLGSPGWKFVSADVLGLADAIGNYGGLWIQVAVVSALVNRLVRDQGYLLLTCK